MSGRLERSDLERIKASASLRELAEQRRIKLKRNGSRHDWWGCCPFHQERSPSFVIHEDKGFYHCFGCGAHGRAFDLVMQLDGVDFREAARRIAGHGPLPDLADVRRREVAQKAAEERELADKEQLAARIWAGGRPIEPGDIADRYLAGRGLRPPEGGWWPPSLRLGRWVSDAGNGWPALLAAVTRWPDRRVVAVQITPLAEPGVKAWSKPPRLTRGELRCGAVRLAAYAEGRVVTVTEGVEDGLAVLQDDATAVPWAALGTANVARLILPPGCPVELTLDGDNPGRWAVETAESELVDRGHVVRVARLPDGLDPLEAQHAA